MQSGTVKFTNCVCGNIVSICTTHTAGHCKTHRVWVGTLSVFVGAHHMLWGTVKLTHSVFVGKLPLSVGAHHMLWGTVKLKHCVWELCKYLYVHTTGCRALQNLHILCGNTLSICRYVSHAIGNCETHTLCVGILSVSNVHTTYCGALLNPHILCGNSASICWCTPQAVHCETHTLFCGKTISICRCISYADGHYKTHTL